MQTAKQGAICTAEEYLTTELHATEKHEYIDGHIYAMAGASRDHNIIVMNLSSHINAHLGDDCRVYSSDMKLNIKTKAGEAFYYPDIMVSCDPEPPSKYIEDKPTFVCEVLSETTAIRDSNEKLYYYTCIDSLKEYMLIDSLSRAIYVHRKIGDSWILNFYDGNERVLIDSVGITVGLDEIYRKTDI